MVLSKITGKISGFFKKNRYVILILIIGLSLMVIPNYAKQTSAKVEQAPSSVPANTSPPLEEKLANILSEIRGAGDVKVLLTQASGEETVYQTNLSASSNTGSQTTQVDTVILSNTDRSEGGMVRQVNPPTYLGAIIICEGADNANIRLAVVDAVSKVTGLGANRISVLKMK